MAETQTKRRRRGHGEGSIYQRADGRWVAEVNLGYIDGKRKRRTFYRKTRKEATATLTEELTRVQRGVSPSPTMTVEAFLHTWLAETIDSHRAMRTVESYRSLVELHIIPQIGRIRLGKLTQSDVQAMMNRKAAAGLSARTVAYIRAVLRSALTDAMRRGMLDRNVAQYAQPPRGEAREPAPFTDEELDRLFQTVRERTKLSVKDGVRSVIIGDRFEAAYLIAGTYGLRRGEVLGIRWLDIDTERRELHVRQQVQRVGGRDQVVPLKTKKSRRTLPLTADVEAALDRRKRRQAQERAFAGEGWQESGLVFTSTKGTALNPQNFYTRYKGILEEAGLAGHTFHDLRHSAATLLARRGVPPRVAMEILGHSDIATTMNIYTHVMGDHLREVFAAREPEPDED
jgi:integrase